MTIKSQAETIRDETVAGANTAERVGTCLVDIAGVLESEPCFAFASAIDNSSATDISVAGTYYPANISAMLDSFSRGFGVTPDGSIVYSPADGRSRLFHVTMIASLYCNTGSHVILARIGDDDASFSKTTTASVTAGSASKRTQHCVSGIWLAAPGDAFRLWITENDHAESITVTNLSITAAPVGVFSMAT